MYTYTIEQWFLFFYVYCFIGWIWESCYVSAKKKQWVNRGFLHGPWLPIYGSGAMAILLTTIPVKEHIGMIFLVGMLSSTLLEFCTGACMERMFHVRYWDYSNQPLNVKGYICVPVSLGWGCFSVLLIKVIHVPVEHLILMISQPVGELLAFGLTILMVIDYTQSFNEALDLRDMLTKLTESNEQIRRIQRRLDVAAAFAEENRKEKAAKKLSRREQFMLNVEASKNKRMAQLENLYRSVTEKFKEKTENTNTEGRRYQETIKKIMGEIHSLTNRAYRRSANLLKRNPGAVSSKYAEALNEIRELTKKKK